MRIDGRLQDTTWDSCLDDLGAKLKDLIDRHGPESVGFYFSTMESAGFRMAEALHAAIGTPAKFSPLTIDGTAKPLISDLVGGFMGLSGRTDLDRCDFLLLVGVQPGGLPWPCDLDAQPDRHGTRDRQARASVGDRPAAHRNRAAGHRPSGGATEHRPRRVGLSGS
ncbi:hypothetical protein [Mycobacterium genavense]|uniref:hypothetical protein n=1 Tax=Mycobacterium genavense TaxID=36812 RepID=UPI0004AFE066|nr:hypothetical protein [Mycobacterium genavense]